MAREAIRLRGTGGQGDELVLTTIDGAKHTAFMIKITADGGMVKM